MWKKFRSGERGDTVAVAGKPSAGDEGTAEAVGFLDERDDGAAHGPPSAFGGLYTQCSPNRSQLAQLGFVSSHRTLRALHVIQPVRRRGPDLPVPRALGA